MSEYLIKNFSLFFYMMCRRRNIFHNSC